MLDRYRRNKPAAPVTVARVAPPLRVLPPPADSAQALRTLETYATERGIDWPAARSQMIDGDAEAALRQLDADTGDGLEHAGVVAWLCILAARARA